MNAPRAVLLLRVLFSEVIPSSFSDPAAESPSPSCVVGTTVVVFCLLQLRFLAPVSFSFVSILSLGYGRLVFGTVGGNMICFFCAWYVTGMRVQDYCLQFVLLFGIAYVVTVHTEDSILPLPFARRVVFSSSHYYTIHMMAV